MELVLGLIYLGLALAALVCWAIAIIWETKEKEVSRRATVLAIVFISISGFTLCLAMGSRDFWLNTAVGIIGAIGLAFAMWWTSLLQRTGGHPFKPLCDVVRQRRQQGK